jgi:hypothetical protein
MPRNSQAARKIAISVPRPNSLSRRQSALTIIRTQEPQIVRGVRLKYVSYFTMLFALLCLLAFLAGNAHLPA